MTQNASKERTSKTSRNDLGSRPRRNLAAVAALAFLSPAIAAAVDSIDASVDEVGVTDRDLVTNESISIVTADYEVISLALDKHEQSALCRWSVVQPQGQSVTAVAQERLIFWIDFYLDNKVFAQERWNLEKGERFGKRVLTKTSEKVPLSAGKHSLSCKVSFNYATPGKQAEDPDSTNNQKTARLFVADSPWDALFPEEIPPVSVAARPVFANLTPDLAIDLNAVEHGVWVRGQPTFYDYALGAKHTARIHYRITRVVGAKETVVGDIELGFSDYQPYRIVLDSDWFSKHGVGAGDYRVRSFFTQVNGRNIATGPITQDAAEFTLAELELANRPLQPPIGVPDEKPTAVGSAAVQQQSVTVAPAARALRTQSTEAQAPPNLCRKSVSYYVPEAPVLVTNGTALQVNDQFQIQCTFKKVTREVAWPQCDDAARTALRVLQGAQESGGRTSGIVSIDGSTVGVSSSPDGGGEFQSLKLWKFDSPGEHEISCQTDNAFRFAIEGEETYLKAAVSIDVSMRSDGRTFRGFEPDTAATIPVRQMPSEAMPRLRGLVTKSSQPGVTSLHRMTNGRPSPVIADVERALSGQQLSDLQAIADAIARDDSLTPETENQWLSLLTEYRQQPGDLDVNELVQLVLRESYMNRNEGLRNVADKTKFFNEKKKEIRGEIVGSTPQQVATALLDLADQSAQTTGNDTDASVSLAAPWNRTVLSCVLKPGGELKINGINQYGVWARNTSDRVLDTGQMITWRAEATTSSGTPFGGSEKKISLHDTSALQTELPVGEEVLIGSRVTTGKISKCEMWAQ